MRRSIRHSIPPITSTGRTRSSKVSSLKGGTFSAYRETNDVGHEGVQPVIVRKRARLPEKTMSSFPERAELCIDEHENGLDVIVEFPGHTIEQIRWGKKGNVFVIESLLLLCSYRNKIMLPDWVEEPLDVRLHNQILIMRFERNKQVPDG